LVEIIALSIHSFIPDIYIAPLQDTCTYSEALSVQLSQREISNYS